VIGVVADDGTLTFPGLGPRKTSFAGDLRTADLLLAATRKEQTTTVVEHP
jgi:hypothetical protein